MKISDIMLDLATGDASIHDAYIQESMGQVKVSAAIYNAASQIAELDDSERSGIVQECAEAGLPSDREGSVDLAYEAVQNELLGTCRHLFSEMAKFNERATKPTTPYAAMNAVAKQLGCQSTLDGSLEYAMEYASSVVKGKDITLASGTRHVKGKSAERLTKNLIQGVGLICNALCINTDSFYANKDIQAVVSAPVSTKCPDKDDCTLAYMTSALSSAKKFLKEKDLKASDYTTKPTQEDVAKVTACDAAVTKLAKFVKGKLGEYGGEYTEDQIKSTIEKSKKKRVSDAAKDLNNKNDANESQIVQLNNDLNTLCTNLMKAFNDSADAMITTKNEG